jgi:signal transduction histidine kinase/CheY-like chemotaxis protein
MWIREPAAPLANGSGEPFARDWIATILPKKQETERLLHRFHGFFIFGESVESAKMAKAPMTTKPELTGLRKTEAETQVLQQKFARLSQAATCRELASWIAHELNQPLAAILSNAQAAVCLVAGSAPDLNELREILNDIIADNQRAAEVIRSMRSMLKQGAADRQPLLLDDLINEILPIVHNDACAQNIIVEVDFGPSLLPAAGDRVQLQQVILNLVANAFEGINASGRPGKLMLRTRQVEGEVVLDVTDSGIGIPSDKLHSIFEPLITTKADGLGMGLALSRSIVIGHNGRLWAENSERGGAAFHMALPVVHSLTQAPTSGTVQTSAHAAGPRPRGLIVLIADDDESFRRAVASIMAKMPGLELLAEAADGEEAVTKAADLHPDLILLDVGLPKINGVEAAARMRKVAPKAKTLLLTQHDSPDFVEAALRAGAMGYVLKVDVGRELLRAATVVLGGEQYLSSGVRGQD